MQLTSYTDFSLRVLMFVAINKDRLVTVREITNTYNVSRHHMVKVVHNLAKQGFLQTTRGKYGGVRLGRAPHLINIGEVVRCSENNMDIVECLKDTHCDCPITPVCPAKLILKQASDSFLNVLSNYTLADLTIKRDSLSKLYDQQNMPALPNSKPVAQPVLVETVSSLQLSRREFDSSIV